MSVRIAIDCMGGDHGLAVTIPAAVSFLAHEPSVRLLLVGREAEVRAALSRHRAVEDGRLDVLNAEEAVAMDESPSAALRSKRQSSMRLAIEAVKEGRADACVSAGNTGALMAISRFVLKMLEGMDRPAIATQMPNRLGGMTTVLDVGANVDCEPEHMLQFAMMGAALVTALDRKERPTVGLLNIGEEVIKGNETVKRAAELLRSANLNFVGNVEGNDVFSGKADVIVCDGFVGNVALKTSEGLAQMLAGFIREEYERHLFTRLLAVLSFPVLRRFRNRLDHRRFNGAALVGLRGVVVKSHGSADAFAFEAALRRAFDSVRNGLLQGIADNLARAAAAPPAGIEEPVAAAQGSNIP